MTLDQRGHGHSTKTGTLEGYTIQQLSSDLAGFLDAVGGGPVDLLGHSMGGRVAVTLVLERPELVRSLILMDTSAWSFVPDDEGVRDLVRAFFDGFDPSAGTPEQWGMRGPEDDLIAAAVPASWQQEKDVIQAGTDPYAIKGLGSEILAHDEGPGPCDRDWPRSSARRPSSPASTTTPWSIRRRRWRPRWPTGARR